MAGNGNTGGSRAAIDEALVHVRQIVAAVRDGDLSGEARLSFPDDHPLGALALGVNSMFSSLRRAREASTDHLQQIEHQIATIDAQREAIRELSTPIIEVWRSVLCLPIVGVMDSARAGEITHQLLATVAERGAAFVIIDITGIQVMDSGTTDNFVRLARSVTLLGAECVLSGINPTIAKTLVDMGVDLADLKTHRSLRDALRHYVKALSRTSAAEGDAAESTPPAPAIEPTAAR